MDNPQAIENSLIARIYRGGNKCGHDKFAPFLALARPTDNKPPFLYTVGEAFKAYFFDPDLFPSLNHAHSSRQQRSERREAVVVTMLSVLEFTDLASLRVGIPTTEGFKPLKLDVLQRRTNLHPRRFERAIQTLCMAGILKVSAQHTMRTYNGGWAYFPSVRRINRAFFIILGFGQQLIEEMKAASDWLREKAAKLGSSLSAMANIRLMKAGKEFKDFAEQRQDIRKKRKERIAKEKAKILIEVEQLLATRSDIAGSNLIAKQLALAHQQHHQRWNLDNI